MGTFRLTKSVTWSVSVSTSRAICVPAAGGAGCLNVGFSPLYFLTVLTGRAWLGFSGLIALLIVHSVQANRRGWTHGPTVSVLYALCCSTMLKHRGLSYVATTFMLWCLCLNVPVSCIFIENDCVYVCVWVCSVCFYL